MCAGRELYQDSALSKMSVPYRKAMGSIVISVDADTTVDEIDRIVSCLDNIVSGL